MNRREFVLGVGAALGGATFTLGELLEAQGGPGFRFVDVTRQAGITFTHNNGAYGGKRLPETLGSGCAFVDFDGDGWQDILLVNAMDWPGHRRRRTVPGGLMSWSGGRIAVLKKFEKGVARKVSADTVPVRFSTGSGRI